MLLLPYEFTKASMMHFTPKLIRNLNVILIGILAWLCMSSVFAEGTVTPKQGILNSMSSLGQRFGLSAPDNTFLEPDRAFIFSADVKGANTIIAHWEIADGYYMYREKFVFKLIDDGGVKLGPFQAPPGKFKTDETFGDTEVYYDQVSLTLPLQNTNTTTTPITLEAQYQGCADAGFCYPPIKKTIELVIPASSTTISPTTPTLLADSSRPGPLPEQDRIAQLLASDKTLPILLGIIVGQGEHITSRRAFTLSLAYVLVMSVTYTIAGVIAGLFGSNLQIAFQNPWILGSFSILFVLL